MVKVMLSFGGLTPFIFALCALLESIAGRHWEGFAFMALSVLATLVRQVERLADSLQAQK